MGEQSDQVNNKFTEINNSSRKNTDELKMLLLGKQGNIERKMDDLVKKNLRKLNDVESLLETRASK